MEPSILDHVHGSHTWNAWPCEWKGVLQSINYSEDNTERKGTHSYVITNSSIYIQIYQTELSSSWNKKVYLRFPNHQWFFQSSVLFKEIFLQNRLWVIHRNVPPTELSLHYRFPRNESVASLPGLVSAAQCDHLKPMHSFFVHLWITARQYQTELRQFFHW